MNSRRISLPALVQTPGAARWFGLAGLLPQAAAVWMVMFGGDEWRFYGLALAFAYAALILSFLGGIWWGFATRADRAPAWMYALAVVPTLIALASAIPWMTGDVWPQPSLVGLGIALLLSPFGDAAYHRRLLTPAWWMSLRVLLSLGLGALTLIVGRFGTDGIAAL